MARDMPKHFPRGTALKRAVLGLFLVESIVATGESHGGAARSLQEHDATTRMLNRDDPNSLESYFEAHYVTSFSEDDNGNLRISDDDLDEIRFVVELFEPTYNTLVEGFENPYDVQVQDVELIYVTGLGDGFSSSGSSSSSSSKGSSGKGSRSSSSSDDQRRRRQQRSRFPNVRTVFRVRGSCNGCGGTLSDFTDQVGRRMQVAPIHDFNGEDALAKNTNTGMDFAPVRFLSARGSGRQGTFETGGSSEMQDNFGTGSGSGGSLESGLPSEQQVLDAYSIVIMSLDLDHIFDVVYLNEFDNLTEPRGPVAWPPSRHGKGRKRDRTSKSGRRGKGGKSSKSKGRKSGKGRKSKKHRMIYEKANNGKRVRGRNVQIR